MIFDPSSKNRYRPIVLVSRNPPSSSVPSVPEPTTSGEDHRRSADQERCRAYGPRLGRWRMSRSLSHTPPPAGARASEKIKAQVGKASLTWAFTLERVTGIEP